MKSSSVLQQESAKSLVLQSIQKRLLSRTVSRPSNWVKTYRLIESIHDKKVIEPWSFKYHPWSKEMLDCKDPHWCSQKGAQLSISEVLINLSLFSIDQLSLSVLYGLPSERPDARDFCLTRFNTVLKLSPYIRSMFNEHQAMSPKMAGTRALYIRGSRGGATFDSIPVGLVCLDEVDKMSETAVSLARERMSGHTNMYLREASTPSIPGRGVNKTFEKSTQDFFAFKCPHCSRLTHLIFPDCLIIKPMILKIQTSRIVT